MSEPAAEFAEPDPRQPVADDGVDRVVGQPPTTRAETVTREPDEVRAGKPLSKPRQPRTVGLTGRGVVVLIFVVTVLTGLIDMAIVGHRGSAFGIVFVLASAAGALVVRRRDLSTAMVTPPLLYCVAIALMSLVDRGGLAGGPVTTEAYYIGNAFVTGAPAIWTGTALACAIGWYRKRR